MAESNSGGVLVVPRLNAIVNELDLHVVILGSMGSMGYDSPTETQISAIEKFVHGYDIFISLPTCSGKALLRQPSRGVIDRLRRLIKVSDDNLSIGVVSPLSALMQDQDQV